MDFLTVLLFIVLMFCIFYALLFFFAGILRFNYLISELLSAMAIFLLLFGETMFFLKIFAVIFGFVVFSSAGYTIIVRAKKMRWQNCENKQNRRIY